MKADRTQELKFGYSLGMAFQINDDILDYVGEEAKVVNLWRRPSPGINYFTMLYFLQDPPTDPAILETKYVSVLLI
jgi:geranylgeranyl pyrophosphate synthase